MGAHTANFGKPISLSPLAEELDLSFALLSFIHSSSLTTYLSTSISIHNYSSLCCGCVQGIKRKWEGFTGVPLPKKLKTSSSSSSSSSVPPAAAAKTEAAATRVTESMEKENNRSRNDVKIDIHDNIKKAAIDQKVVSAPVPVKKTVAVTTSKKAAPASSTTTTANDAKPAGQPTEPMQQTTATSHPPHHPHDDIDVDNLKWNDLRKAVKKHGLNTAGRKFELQERLRNYLEEERIKRLAEWRMKENVGEVEVVEEYDEVMEEEEKKEEEHDEVEIMKKVEVETKVTKEEVDVAVKAVEDETVNDVPMEDIGEEEKPAKSIEASSSSSGKVMSIVKQLSAKNEMIVSGEPMSYETSINAVVPPPPTSSMKNDPPKSALKPSKYAPAATSSTMHSTPVDRAAGKNLLTTLKKDPPTAVSAINRSDKKMMSSSKLEPNSLQKTKLISSIIEETVPSGTSSAFKSAKVESAKLQEKKKNMAAASEARKARLAEMREKVRTILQRLSLCLLLLALFFTSSHISYSSFIKSGLKKCRIGHKDDHFIPSFKVCNGIINSEENGCPFFRL